MHQFAQHVDKHHYLGVATLDRCELNNQINTNAVPPSTGYVKWLSQASCLLVGIVLVLLAHGAVSNILFHLLTHAFPPVQSLHSLLGLGNTQMTTVRAVMHFMQALLS